MKVIADCISHWLSMQLGTRNRGRKYIYITYVYFTTKVDITENIKYSIKYKNKMQTTDY